MKIILEYTYTGSIKIESLKKDNIIEAFYAADYFQLPDLQDFIMKTFKNTLEKNCDDNYSPELLSKLAEKILLTEDNILLNLLVEAVAIIPLNTIEFEQIRQENPVQIENKIFVSHQKVAKELEPLVKLIDFRRIKGQILVHIIEPLGITQLKLF
ncbi:BTB/POZ protein [Rhizophagus irregularis DAOM 181602=DAOM 197198]|nr:BTB/POZ protein [Rhizophagus irregularis DAOM 181602=DAOM 197198]